MEPVTTSREPSTPGELASSLAAFLLRTELTGEQVASACQNAASENISAVLVRPCDVDAALRYLDGSAVRVAAASGYPHGASTTAAKLYEARDLLRRGAAEIAFVLNTGMLLSRQFEYVETELMQISRSCLEHGKALHAVIDAGWLGEDLRVIALKICRRCEVSLVSMPAGLPPFAGLPQMLGLASRILRGECGIGVLQQELGLDDALTPLRLGATRVCCENVAALLAEWRARMEQSAAYGAEHSAAPSDVR